MTACVLVVASAQTHVYPRNFPHTSITMERFFEKRIYQDDFSEVFRLFSEASLGRSRYSLKKERVHDHQTDFRSLCHYSTDYSTVTHASRITLSRLKISGALSNEFGQSRRFSSFVTHK